MESGSRTQRKLFPGKNLELVSERNEPDSIPQTSENLRQKEEAIRIAALTINTGLKALGQRVMTFVALLAGGGMFWWAVLEPTTMRIVAACLYAGLIFLPLAWFDARR